MTSLNLIPEEKIKIVPNSSKSCESLYSTSSSKYSALEIYGKKSTSHTTCVRQPSLIVAGVKEVKQRILSARRLRMKSIQNQLIAAQQTIAELAQENRTLATLRKRSEAALEKYENKNCGYRGLMMAHAEEIRVWRVKYKKLQTFNKELLDKIKRKDDIILKLTDENKHMKQLNNDKNLEEREQLTEKLKQIEEKLLEKEKDIRLLNRKLQLEEKNFRIQLQQESNRYKELQNKFESFKTEINNEKCHSCSTNLNGKISRSSFLPTKTRSYKDIIREQNSCLQRHQDSFKIYQHSRRNENPSNLSSTNARIDNNERDGKLTSKPSLKRSKSTDSLKSEDEFSNSNEKECTNSDLSEDENDLNTELTNMQKNIEFEDSLEEQSNDKKLKENTFENERKKNQAEVVDVDNDNNIDVPNRIVIGKDDEKFSKQKECTSNADYGNKLNEEFVDIRRKITEDYKQREAFLDSFCCQSIESPNNLKKGEIIQKRKVVDPTKKSKLLAALKNIDAEKNDKK